MTMSEVNRIPTPLNRFRTSRLRSKLLPVDDNKLLIALPKDIPERSWVDVLQKEETELICYHAREYIVECALSVCYRNYLDQQTVSFTLHCTEQALLKLFDWEFYHYDPGDALHPLEENCKIRHIPESWERETEKPSDKDSLVSHRLPVYEMQEDAERKNPPIMANMVEDYQHVKPISSEYWFPGRIEFNQESEDNELLDNELETDCTDHSNKVSESIQMSSTSTSLNNEVLEKITDYQRDSIQECERDGSGLLHGAGDSKVRLSPERIKRNQNKRTSSRLSKASVQGLKPLPPISSGKTSPSDVRSVRLQTHADVSPTEHLLEITNRCIKAED